MDTNLEYKNQKGVVLKTHLEIMEFLLGNRACRNAIRCIYTLHNASEVAEKYCANSDFLKLQETISDFLAFNPYVDLEGKLGRFVDDEESDDFYFYEYLHNNFRDTDLINFIYDSLKDKDDSDDEDEDDDEEEESDDDEDE